MKNKNGDILISIGSELNPSFEKTLTRASGAFGRIFNLLQQGAASVNATSEKIEALKTKISESNVALELGSEKWKKYKDSLTKSTDNIDKSKKRIADYEEKIKKLKASIRKGNAPELEVRFKTEKITKKIEEIKSKMGSISKVKITAELAQKDYDATLKAYAKKAEGGGKISDTQTKKLDELKKKAEAAQKLYQASLKGLGDGSESEKTKKLFSRLEEEENKLKRVNKMWAERKARVASSVDAVNQKIEQEKAKIESEKESINRVTGEWINARQTAEQEIGILEQRLALLETQRQQQIASLSRAVRSELIDTLSKGLDKIKGAIRKVATVGLKAFGRLSGIFSSTSSKALTLSKAIRLIVQYGFGFRSLYYLVRRLRTSISDGFEYLGGAIKSAKKSISGFSEQIGKDITNLKEFVYFFKSSLGASLQPILTAVMPLLQKLIEYVSKLSVMIATFFATLSGKQTTIYKASTNLEDYANAIDQTTASAKELQNQLAGFDEMNVLTKNTTSSGTELDTSGWFTEETLQPSDFANMLLNAVENADFTAVGNLIGAKFKEMLGNINWIDYLDDNGELQKGIFTKITDLAKSFGTFLNGLLTTEGLGLDIGNTIGNILNGISLFIQTWVSTPELWTNLGSFITDAINGLIETFNGEQFGESLKTFLNGLITTVGTILTDTNWEELGKDIGDMLATLDLPDLVSKLGELVGKIVSGIGEALKGWAETDPESFGFAAALTTAIGLADLTLFGLKLVARLTDEKIWTLVGTALSEVAGFTFGDAFTAFLVNKKTDGFIKAVIQLIKDVGVLLAPIAGILALVGGAIMAIVNTVKMLIAGFSTSASLLKDLGLIIAAIGAVILGAPAAVAAVVAAIVAFFVDIVVSIKDAWDESKSIWENIKDGFIQGVNNIKDKFVKLWEDLVAKVKKILGINSPSKVFAGIGENIMLGLFNGLKSVWEKIVDWINKIVTNITNAFEKVKDTVVNIFNKIKELIKTPINGIIGLVNGLVSGLITGINKCIEALNRINVTVPSWVPVYGGRRFGFNLSKLNIPQIPYLAEGAVIPPNRKFLAMLGDQTSGTNIEAPLDTIVEAMQKALGSSNNGNINVNLVVDGKVLAKTVAKYNNQLSFNSNR